MSWPDGDPRFIVREHTGYPIYADGKQGHVERTEIMVMDRACNHKVVWSSWHNKLTLRLPLHKQRAHAHLVAHTLERMDV